MTRRLRLHSTMLGSVVLCAALLTTGRSAAAQSAPAPRDTGTASHAARDEHRILTVADYGRWSFITLVNLSPDGQWMTYAYQPNVGDVTLHVRELDGTRQYTSVLGPSPEDWRTGFTVDDASRPTFSSDSRWLGYYRKRDSTTASPRRFELLDLATGTTWSVGNAESARFSNDGKWVAVRRQPLRVDTSHSDTANADTTRKAGDLILRELGTGRTRSIGNVGLYAFDSTGTLLVYTVDAADQLGNGIYLMNLTSGETRPLDTTPLRYAQLAWSTSGTDLAVLRGETRHDTRRRENVVLVWTDLDTQAPATHEYNPSRDQRFPHDVVVSELAPLQWSPDRSWLMLGLKKQIPDSEPPAHTTTSADVDVWHWKDRRLQSEQMGLLAETQQHTAAAVLRLHSNTLMPLADSVMRIVSPIASSRWAIGIAERPYLPTLSGSEPARADYYRVDLQTGERTLIARGLARTLGTSPDGKWFLYVQAAHVTAYNLMTGTSTVIDGGVEPGFIDVDDDKPEEKPSYGLAGWSSDGQSVIMNHRYDLWRLSLAGGKPVNLTAGVGDRRHIRFRIVAFDPHTGRVKDNGLRVDNDMRAVTGPMIDLGQPQILSAFGTWTKKSGYWRLTAGQQPVPLIWKDEAITVTQKARSADRVLFTRQTFKEPPDYWTSAMSFAHPRKITDANPQRAEYAWGSKVLIDYTTSMGRKLQGTLTLPAGYTPGKRYPMLVYIYERFSDTHHEFSMPRFDDRPQMSTYASNGYLVLQPDIVYEIGRPGSSALDCVMSATRKVIALGYADSAHIGLQGHSWGGYESTYIATHPNPFAAIVAGAPPTNLVSLYGNLYKPGGTMSGGILERGQGRMGAGVTPWSAHEPYDDQSPVYHIQDLVTPLLLLAGTADETVPWSQSLTFFNEAWRLGKPVILLSYPGEPHHLEKRANQIDFQVKMKQFFDHYLKGAPAPSWMTDGVSQLQKHWRARN